MKRAQVSKALDMIDCKEVTTVTAERCVDLTSGDKTRIRIVRVRDYVTSGRKREVELTVHVSIPEARELALALYPEFAVYEQMVRDGKVRVG